MPNNNSGLISEISTYIKNREMQPQYKTYFGRLFGYSKDEKINAANALLNYIKSPKNLAAVIPHLNVLNSEGDLNKIWITFQQSNPSLYAFVLLKVEEIKQAEHRNVFADGYDSDSPIRHQKLDS